MSGVWVPNRSARLLEIKPAFEIMLAERLQRPHIVPLHSAGESNRVPGTGDADSEVVTIADGGSAGGIYMAAERDNNNGVSRNSTPDVR